MLVYLNILFFLLLLLFASSFFVLFHLLFLPSSSSFPHLLLLLQRLQDYEYPSQTSAMKTQKRRGEEEYYKLNAIPFIDPCDQKWPIYLILEEWAGDGRRVGGWEVSSGVIRVHTQPLVLPTICLHWRTTSILLLGTPVKAGKVFLLVVAASR